MPVCVCPTMFNFKTLTVILIFSSFCEISSTEIQSENEIGENGVVPCISGNIDINFHRISSVKFFKSGVKEIYS